MQDHSRDEPDIYVAQHPLPIGSVYTLHRVIRALKREIDRAIEDHPGTVVERRDAYLIADGGEWDPVMIRSHVLIDMTHRHPQAPNEDD